MRNLLRAIGATMVLLVGYSNFVEAQVIKFERTVHDFGTVSEDVGDISYEFEFINTGDKPLVIQRVNASCGCTTPGWTKEPVPPGGKGFVKAIYGAKGRVYAFDKTLTVLSNSTKDAKTILHIKGNVIAKPVDLKVAYPNTIGDLRIKEIKDFNFPRVMAGTKSKFEQLEVANDLDVPLKIALEYVPEYIEASAEPTTLQPKQKGVIRFLVDGSKRKSFGYAEDNIIIRVGSAKQNIKISSLVAPAPTKLTDAEKDRIPVIHLETSTIKFGNVAKGKDINVEVGISNKGQSELIVKRLTSNDPSVNTTFKPFKIKAGKSHKLKLHVKNPKSGDKKIKVFLESSDPLKGLLEINLEGTVE